MLKQLCVEKKVPFLHRTRRGASFYGANGAMGPGYSDSDGKIKGKRGGIPGYRLTPSRENDFPRIFTAGRVSKSRELFLVEGKN